MLREMLQNARRAFQRGTFPVVLAALGSLWLQAFFPMAANYIGSNSYFIFSCQVLKVMSDRNNRIIISGQLEFGSDRVYEQTVEQYIHRTENFYKNVVLLKSEEIFNEESRTIDIPRKVLEATNREWLNTLKLLERIATFSIAGNLNLWRLQEGKLLEHHVLEPQTDRTTTQLFEEGRNLMDRQETLGEAKEALSKAIENYDRHAMAYERRGFTNYQLANYQDALYDYNKSINISPSRPEPYYGRGVLYFKRLANPTAAIADFTTVTELAIPHQDIYWLARALMGDALLSLGKKAEAQREFRMFINRKQDEIASLKRLDRRVAVSLATLFEAENKRKEAHTLYEKALASPEDPKAPSDEEIQQLRKKNLGKLGEANQKDSKGQLLSAK